MHQGKCPVCGTSGRLWKREPDVFTCPNCSSVFSNFGIVIESGNEEFLNWWS